MAPVFCLALQVDSGPDTVKMAPSRVAGIGIERTDEPLAAAEAISQLHRREMPRLLGGNLAAERRRARRRQGADDAGHASYRTTGLYAPKNQRRSLTM